jgi:hypothetical protein
MARRQALIAKKVTKPRVTRTEAYLINSKYLGDEPEFKSPITESEYGKALTWYNYMCTTDDAREYITTFLIERNRKAEAKLLAKLDNCWVPTSVAWRCRMISRGYQVPYENDFLESELAKNLARVEIKPEFTKISIQDRMREKTQDVIGDIEEMIDTNKPFSLYDWMKAQQLPAAYCNAIIAFYTPILDELIEALDSKDPQLKEGYSYFTKKELRDRVVFFNKIIEDCEQYSNVTKKVRKPRKPRTVSAEKKLKHLKYQKEDGTFKIASINPEKIIGCQELWTFNTKTKVVTVFRAIDRGGLQFNRTSIVGYDEKQSFSRSTGRKTEYCLDKIQNGGKIILRKLIDELKTEKALQTRINETTILMKVV